MEVQERIKDNKKENGESVELEKRMNPILKPVVKVEINKGNIKTAEDVLNMLNNDSGSSESSSEDEWE